MSMAAEFFAQLCTFIWKRLATGAANASTLYVRVLDARLAYLKETW